MINKIIDFSIENKFIVGLFTLTVVIFGIYSLNKVPIDAVPDITNNQVQIITLEPNLETENIEKFVTSPIEIAVSNLPGIEEIRSISRFGLSVVTIVFNDDMGTYLPRQLVSEKLTEIQKDIPENFGVPFIGPISTGLGEIYQYTLEVSEKYKDKYSLIDLRTIQDWIINRQMAMVPGVIEVNSVGGGIKQYEISIDPNELRAIDMTITDVFVALENNNQNVGSAYIEKDHRANFIHTEGLIRDIEDIKNIVVKNIDGVPVKIKDIAKINIGRGIRYGALTKDGEGEAVGGIIMMLKGANSNEVIDDVKKRISQIQKSLPEGISIVPFLDRSELIFKTTDTITTNLLEGGLVVIFVLVLLLGNWRGGLIVASTIPLSLLVAFIFMNIFGVWANLMSLGAIDFGIIIDGAVIIVESTVFLIRSKILKNVKITKEERNSISSTSAKKMMNSAFFGQLIILIVFIPILVLEGIEGKMFKPMAMTFIFVMVGAMILCLTYVPMMSSIFLKVSKSEKRSYGNRFVKWVEGIYEPLLIKAFKNSKTLLFGSIVLFGISIFILTKMGGEFIPKLDEGSIAFHALLKPGSSLSESVQVTTKIEKIVKSEFPEVETIVSRIGIADVPTDPMPMDVADIFVIFKPDYKSIKGRDKQKIIEDIKENVSIIPGVNYEFTQPIEMRFNELITGVREDVAIKLFGDNLEILADKAEQMSKMIGDIEGIADMKVEAITGLPQISIDYDRDKIAQYGLEINKLNTVVQSTFAGGKAGVIFEGEKKFDLVVRLNEGYRGGIEDLKNIFISLPNGGQIPLREVADINYKQGVMQISHDNTNRRIYVGINIRNRDVESVVNEIKQRLDGKFVLPPGYYIRYGGAFENLQRANNKLKMVVPISLFLIFILVFFALKSISHTIIIYLSIPVATIGGIFALWVRDMNFSISAGIGFIVLFGVAVLNGLVMVSGFNDRRKQKNDINLRESILKGAKRRVRPIMLTAFTDILGFLPLAISTSPGSEVQRPLATVVIGGLITSTFLTLYILPILYNWVESRKIQYRDRLRRINLSNNKALGMVVITIFFGINFSKSQENIYTYMPEIGLDEAVRLSRENFYLLKKGELEVKKQKANKKNAWNLGQTQIYTGADEIGDGRGVHTVIGIQQNDMDLLGIISKSSLYGEYVELAQDNFKITKLQMEKEVKKMWVNALGQKKKYQLYKRLDSIYSDFEKAMVLNYQVEAVSKLDKISAKNSIIQNKVKLEQSYNDYLIALQKLNLWLGTDIFYTVSDNFQDNLEVTFIPQDSLDRHPSITFFEKKLNVAESSYSVAKSQFLPKFNLQFGVQKIDGRSDFYSYQFGVSVPLFPTGEIKNYQMTKLDRNIAKYEMDYNRMKIKSEYNQMYLNYVKWKSSWDFYKNEALLLAKEQVEGAIFSYRQGAIDYTTFNQTLRQGIQIELDAIDAFSKYIDYLFELQFFEK